MPTDRAKAIKHRDKASQLNESWNVGAVQSRYSDDGHWYAQLKRFPAALFDANGYVLFADEESYLSAPMSIGKQISVPKPGISKLPGYVRFRDISESSEAITESISVVEGRELLRLHRTRERNRTMILKKKKSILSETGKLACEVCEFDFNSFYGMLGSGFAECHHVFPLWQTIEFRETRLTDLAIVCSNCHRMLHRRPWHSIVELRAVLRRSPSPDA